MKKLNNWSKELIPVSYQLKDEFEKMNHTPVTFNRSNSPFYSGVKWAVRQCGNCLGTDGQWHYEMMPSSRTPDFYALCRFDSLELAVATYKVSQMDNVKEVDKPVEPVVEKWVPFVISAGVMEGAVNNSSQWESFVQEYDELYSSGGELLNARCHNTEGVEVRTFVLYLARPDLDYGPTLGEFFKENNIDPNVKSFDIFPKT